MKNLFYAFLAFIAIINFSCKEACDDIVCQNNGTCVSGECDCPDGFRGEFCEEKILKLKKTYLNGELIQSFEYNSDGLVSKSILTSYDIVQNTYNYYQDSIIIVTSVLGQSNQDSIPMASVEKFFELEGDTIKREFYRDGDLLSIRKYFNKDIKCGFTRIDQLGGETSISYVDENCSSNQDFTFDNILKTSTETILDGKKYVFESIVIPYSTNLQAGNILTRKHTDHTTGIIYLSTNEYEYNEYDYPTKRISYRNGEWLSESTYEYYE